MDTIASRLKIIRNHLKKDQNVFAEELGLGGRTTISNWERGISFPPADILALMREKYGINIHWLLTGEGSMYGRGDDCAPALDRSPIETEMLRQIIEGIEIWLKQERLLLEPDKKAQMIVLFYEQFQKENEVNEDTMRKFLRVVAK